MSHSIVYPNLARGLVQATVTIINYTAGGEVFNSSDFTSGNSSLVTAYLFSSNNNSLGVLLIPIRSGSTVKLFQWTASGFAELPTTVGLNAVFDVLVSLT